MKAKIVGVIIGLVVVVGAAYTALSLTKVGQGEVGVVYSMKGGVKQETLGPGFHFVGPFDKVRDYPVSQQQLVLSNNASDFPFFLIRIFCPNAHILLLSCIDCVHAGSVLRYILVAVENVDPQCVCSYKRHECNQPCDEPSFCGCLCLTNHMRCKKVFQFAPIFLFLVHSFPPFLERLFLPLQENYGIIILQLASLVS